jgi:hypothetical protein
MVRDDIARTLEQYSRHAVVRAYRPTVINGLGSPALHPLVTAIFEREAQFPRNYFLGEIAFGNKKGHDENPRRECRAQHGRKTRFQLPEGFDYLSENAAVA